MTGGMGFDITNPAALRKLMSDPSSLADLLQEQHGETGNSPADIFADTINNMRADTARIAAAEGVDMEIQRMTPEVAGELLASTVAGDGVKLVEMFNEEARRRDEVLKELLDAEEYEQFKDAKESAMFTNQG